MTDNVELRTLIRQALREVLADSSSPPSGANTKPSKAEVAVVEPIDLSTDDHVHAFVCRILDLSGDPETALRLRKGTVRFVHARAVQGASSYQHGTSAIGAGGVPSHSERIDSGAVTEAHIRRLRDGVSTLVLGRRAVLTPLARERARMQGIVIVKESK